MLNKHLKNNFQAQSRNFKQSSFFSRQNILTMQYSEKNVVTSDMKIYNDHSSSRLFASLFHYIYGAGRLKA